MGQLGWTINLERCVGCNACAVACKAEMNTPKGVRYRRVIERNGGTYPSPKKMFVTMACFHCDFPACLKSCPNGAISKDPNFGIVLIDQNKCVGCKNCRAVCPYGAPQFNSQTGKMEKCTMCVHRVLNASRTATTGLKPACVQACPALALNIVENVQNTGNPPATFSKRSMTTPSVNFSWGTSEEW